MWPKTGGIGSKQSEVQSMRGKAGYNMGIRVTQDLSKRELLCIFPPFFPLIFPFFFLLIVRQICSSQPPVSLA